MVMPTIPRPILKSLPAPPKLNGNSNLSANDMNPLSTPFSHSPFPFASSSRIPPLDSPHVHFPPTPIMTMTETTHSRTTYDRRPIVISPNICELPERGDRDLGGSEETEESYFQLSLPKLGRNTLFDEVACASSRSDFQHGNTLSSPEGAQTSRTRCHSLPDTLVRAPPPEVFSRASLRRLRRHTDPYPSPNPLSLSQVPSLIFDHSSSDSDSDDACVSSLLRAIDGMPEHSRGHGMGISHISLHFPGGLSTTPNISPGFIGPESEEPVAMMMSKPKRPNRRWSGREHFQGLFERLADEGADSSSALDQDPGGVNLIEDLPQTGAKTVSGDSCGLCPFYDRALEGCLGGF